MPSVTLIPVARRLSLLFLAVVSVCFSSMAQSIYVNTNTAIYRLTTLNGQVQLQKINNLCDHPQSDFISSIAIHRDTLYYNSGSNLFRVVPGNPASCELLVTFPGPGISFNSMAADKYGRIFTIDYDTRSLYMYDPYKKELKFLGILPKTPAGDLMFYKDKLLYATMGDGIYEINTDDPSQSSQYMATTGYSFFGLLSFPFDCKSNKIYGVSLNAALHSSDLIELDLDNKHILQKYCTIPYSLYDAASSVDNGNTIGITIDSIGIKLRCGNGDKIADIRVQAFSASDGPISYWLDGAQKNTDGIFTNLSIGKHSLHLENNKGCSLDTLFDINLKPNTRLECEELFVPNAFTPNGDGRNDLFRPVAGANIKELVFCVFNRFGEKIFESRGPTTGWDGRIAGKMQPTGDYIWMISYKDFTGISRNRKGTVMLMR